MFENKTEEQAKKQILEMVSEYCNAFHCNKSSLQFINGNHDRDRR